MDEFKSQIDFTGEVFINMQSMGITEDVIDQFPTDEEVKAMSDEELEAHARNKRDYKNAWSSAADRVKNIALEEWEE